MSALRSNAWMRGGGTLVGRAKQKHKHGPGVLEIGKPEKRGASLRKCLQMKETRRNTSTARLLAEAPTEAAHRHPLS